jgi:hypothetical protein
MRQRFGNGHTAEPAGPAQDSPGPYAAAWHRLQGLCLSTTRPAHDYEQVVMAAMAATPALAVGRDTAI